MDTVSTILISALVAVVAVIIGAKVQRTARFIYPFDCMTLSLITLAVADLIVDFIPVDRFWWAPFFLGYVVGYLVVGRTSYIMVWETSLATKHVTMTPWVIWEERGITYIQIQSNRDLLRRLFCGVRHAVDSNIPLSTDWVVEAKYPMFPLFSRPTVVAESVRTDWEPVHWFWRFRVKRYVTHIDIAYAGSVSKMQLAQDERHLVVLQNQNTSLVNTIHELESQQGPMLMEAALQIEQGVSATSPVNRMHSLVRESMSMRKKKKKEVTDGSQEDAADTA